MQVPRPSDVGHPTFALGSDGGTDGGAASNEEGADKPERILQAAAELLGEGGHAALTVGEISRRAQVSRGLLHYYFDSMEDILLRVIRRNAQQSLEQAAAFLEGASTRRELIEAFADALADALARRPDLYATYYEAYVQSRVHDSVRDQLSRLYQGRRDALAGGLVAAENQGLLHLPFPAEVVASIVMAVSEGVALQYLSDPDAMPLTGVRAAVIEMFDRLLMEPGQP